MKRSILLLGLIPLLLGPTAGRDAGSDAIPSHSTASRALATAGAPSPDLVSRVQADLLAREYWVSATPTGLAAANRENDFRTFFGPTGIVVEDRDASTRRKLVALTLSGLGRGESLASIPSGEITHRGERVEIAREGLGLVEWYENAEEGLEQGFTLARRPGETADQGARRDGTPLIFELAVSGAESALLGDAIRLSSAAGRALAYEKLVVRDARDQVLASHFEVPAPDRIRLVVDDREARYPIVVDPLLTETADTVLESNATNGRLGGTTASAGDVNGDGFEDLIVNTVATGIVRIFHGSATGIASGGPALAATTLTSTQTGTVPLVFGYVVTAAGDVNGDGFGDVIVGAPTFNAGQGIGEGAAFIYHGSATGIPSGNETTAAARLEGDQANASFGFSAASAGDVNGDGYDDVIVGAPQYDAPTINEGAAFVYLGSPTGTGNGNPATAHAQFESNEANAVLGRVASAGDVNADGYADVIVGCPGFNSGHGAALIFHGSATGLVDGNPNTAPTGLAAVPEAGDPAAFGASVAPAGDVNGDGYSDVIVGAFGFGATDTGGAFVFHGSATGVGSTFAGGAPGIITPTGIEEGDFGAIVASAGDVNGDGYADVVISAPSGNGGAVRSGYASVHLGSASGIGIVTTGAAYAFLTNSQTEGTHHASTGPGDFDGDGFDDVVVGISNFDSGQTNEGIVFVYRGGGTGIRSAAPATSDVQFYGNRANAGYGFSIAPAGDVDGDGYTDLIVGAPFYADALSSGGAAFLILGRPSGNLDEIPVPTIIRSDQAGAELGRRVASAGDVNGDGFSDLIVGAPKYDAGQLDEGAAFLFLGSGSGLVGTTPATAHARFESNQASASFGTAVAPAGDVNGDGFGDVLIGASAYDNGEQDEGAAFLFRGSASGMANGSPATAATVLESNQPIDLATLRTASFGFNLASAGDLDGDGFSDIVVGSPGFANGQPNEGAAFIYLGSASGIASGGPAIADAQIESDRTGALLGLDVGSAGDVNADGFGDLILGAQCCAPSPSDPLEPAALIFHGTPAGIASGNLTGANSALRMGVTFANSRAVAASAAGDVNGDGFGDVIIGTQPLQASSSGAAYVHLGSPTGVPAATIPFAHAQIGPLPGSTGLFDQDIATSAGDVNGDGFADVMTAAALFTNLFPSEGGAFLHLGNSLGRSLLVRQRRGDGSGIGVQPGGAAYANGSFVVEALARSARGRERAKLQVEACPAGTPFEAPACTIQSSPTFVDLGTTGALLAQTVTGLTPNTTYSWRARILSTQQSATQPGIIPTVDPSPWFRLHAQAAVGDIRTVPEPRIGTALVAATVALSGAALRRRSRRCSCPLRS